MQRIAHGHAIIGDIIGAEVPAVLAAAHLHDQHHLAQLAFDLGVALYQDVVGQERHAIVGELQPRFGPHHFHGHHDGDAQAGRAVHQPVQGLAEVLAKRRCQRHLQAGNGVDHHARRLHLLHGDRYRVERLVDGKVEWTQVDDAQFAVRDRAVHVDAGSLCPRDVSLRTLFEDDDDARFIAAQAIGDEKGGKRGLAGAGRSRDDDRVALGNAAAHHLIETLDPRRQTLVAVLARLGRARQHARIDLHARLRNAKSVQPGHDGATAQLADLELAHHRVPVHVLIQREDAVGDGENSSVAIGAGRIADQERRDLPTRQVVRQAMHEGFERRAGRYEVDEAAEGVDDDHRGPDVLDLFDDALQDLVQIQFHDGFSQVQELHRRAHSGDVEEVELLLVAQQLERRLAHERDEQPGGLDRRVLEQDLHRHRGLARSGRADDHVEGKLRHAAAQHFVQARHAGLEQGQIDLALPSRHVRAVAGRKLIAGHGFSPLRVAASSAIVTRCPTRANACSVSRSAISVPTTRPSRSM